MKYKVGDIVWCNLTNQKCLIEKIYVGSQIEYNISFGWGKRNLITYEKYLSDFVLTCPVCNQNIKTINSIIEKHNKEDELCYGSFLPIM